MKTAQLQRVLPVAQTRTPFHGFFLGKKAQKWGYRAHFAVSQICHNLHNQVGGYEEIAKRFILSIIFLVLHPIDM